MGPISSSIPTFFHAQTGATHLGGELGDLHPGRAGVVLVVAVLLGEAVLDLLQQVALHDPITRQPHTRVRNKAKKTRRPQKGILAVAADMHYI